MQNNLVTAYKHIYILNNKNLCLIVRTVLSEVDGHKKTSGDMHLVVAAKKPEKISRRRKN